MSNTLYVGNLAWKVTENDLRDLFSQYGEVHSVRLVLDRETGRARGFGFVEMDNAEQALASLEGKDLQGRPLRVSQAQPKAPSHGGGGGGGGGGFRGRR